MIRKLDFGNNLITAEVSSKSSDSWHEVYYDRRRDKFNCTCVGFSIRIFCQHIVEFAKRIGMSHKVDPNIQILVSRKIDISQLKFKNHPRHHKKESDEHWMEKCRVCKELFNKKHEYISEVLCIENGKRVRIDVLDLTTNEKLEVETNKNVSKPFAKTIYISKTK